MRRTLMMLSALALTACADTRTQAHKDHQTVEGAILRALGEHQPWGYPFDIVNARRSSIRPDIICGYWDKLRTRDFKTYVPFAIFADGSSATVWGVGSNWLNNDAPMITQWHTIEAFCGDSFPLPMGKSGAPKV